MIELSLLLTLSVLKKWGVDIRRHVLHTVEHTESLGFQDFGSTVAIRVDDLEDELLGITEF